MRKLACVKRITQIRPIKNTDSIECAIIDSGWPVVIMKGVYTVGELVIYFEIDSWIPHVLAPFLSKSGGEDRKEFMGIVGNRLDTVKLRGQISQGLVLPCLPLLEGFAFEHGTDCSEHLNILKWEDPSASVLDVRIKGKVPNFIYKTNQERCQNLADELFRTPNIPSEPDLYETTIKLDGSSMTVYYFNGEIGVCSHQCELHETDVSLFWKVAHAQGIINALLQYGKNIAVQGELMGENICSNREKLQGNSFHMFDIQDINERRYYRPSERLVIAQELEETFGAQLNHVPIINNTVDFSIFKSIDDLLVYADGKSLNPKTVREGVVFKHIVRDFSFKVISNKFLTK